MENKLDVRLSLFEKRLRSLPFLLRNIGERGRRPFTAFTAHDDEDPWDGCSFVRRRPYKRVDRSLETRMITRSALKRRNDSAESLCILPACRPSDTFIASSPSKRRSIKPTRTQVSAKTPEINRIIFTTVSKRAFQLGQTLPAGDEDVEEEWRLDRQRDTIDAQLKISNSAKAYIAKWNTFIVPLKISSSLYLPLALTKFVEEHKAWIAGDKKLIQQFSLLTSVLTLRGTVNTKCFIKCLRILYACENSIWKTKTKKRPRNLAPLVKEIERHRGVADCFCGKHVSPLDAVICSGTNCPGRYQHRYCIGLAGIHLKDWKCKHCSLETIDR